MYLLNSKNGFNNWHMFNACFTYVNLIFINTLRHNFLVVVGCANFVKGLIMSCGGVYFAYSVKPCVYAVPLLLSLFCLYAFLMFLSHKGLYLCMQEKCESFSNLCFIEFAESQQNPSLPFKLSATCIIFVKGVFI